MPSKRFLIVIVACLAVCVLLTAVTPVWADSREKVVHFLNGKDGAYPYSGVIFDADGNLYGTAFAGGNQSCYQGCGSVFKLSPGANGKWTSTVLHRFSGNDGANPFAGLIDNAGNLYGTTWIGGSSKSCGAGCGVVFRMAPGANGKWTETVLHSFNGYDGANPNARLIFDVAGNLYGTTWDGSLYGCGNVFKLAPGANGKWTETVLHTFNCKDGSIIYAGLVFDTQGNLYGATARGGASDDGTVFKLTPGANGKWTHAVLHSFHGKDGSGPIGDVIFDTLGNLYGTTQTGGDLNDCGGHGCGTVFKLSPAANGKWSETVLHKFNGKDGSYPDASLTFDSAGNLYGTTTGNPGYGTAFKLAPNGNTWTETILHTFTNNKKGIYPDATVIFDSAGNLYGTTIWGGSLNACPNGCGVVFQITP